jgi:hypothetical protein
MVWGGKEETIWVCYFNAIKIKERKEERETTLKGIKKTTLHLATRSDLVFIVEKGYEVETHDICAGWIDRAGLMCHHT